MKLLVEKKWIFIKCKQFFIFLANFINNTHSDRSKNKKVTKMRFTPFLVADKFNQFNTTCLKWTGDFLELIIVLLISAQINKLIGQILKENSEKNSTYFHRDHKLGGYPFH